VLLASLVVQDNLELPANLVIHEYLMLLVIHKYLMLSAIVLSISRISRGPLLIVMNSFFVVLECSKWQATIKF